LTWFISGSFPSTEVPDSVETRDIIDGRIRESSDAALRSGGGFATYIVDGNSAGRENMGNIVEALVFK
jgi:hypothetical protein